MIPKITAPAEKYQAAVETGESTLTDITGVCIIRTNCAEVGCVRPIVTVLIDIPTCLGQWKEQA